MVRRLVLAGCLVVTLAKSASAYEWCPVDAACEDDALQSPPPPPITAQLECDDERFSTAVGICDDVAVDETPLEPVRPPLGCDGVSCSPDDTPAPVASWTFSHTQPVALAARPPSPPRMVWRVAAAGSRALTPGHYPRIERPPRS